MNHTELLINVAETLTLRQYEDFGAQTAVYPEVGTGSITAVAYCALGLAGEAGEIALKVDDLAFADTPELRMKIVAEVGDFLWYVPRLRVELSNAHFDDTTFLDYEKEVLKASVYSTGRGSRDAVAHCALQLAGRAAHISNKVKKLLRDGDSPSKRVAILDEADNCLRYAPRLLHELAEAHIGEIALANIFKLADRQNRGTLRGDGDNR
jgi:hypothetical protein